MNINTPWIQQTFSAADTKLAGEQAGRAWRELLTQEATAVAAHWAATRAGVLCLLDGTLGAGKTVWVSGFLTALDINLPAVSPTFTLCIPYSGAFELWHLDAYRIKYWEELDDLDLDEALQHNRVILIEWGSRISEGLPEADWHIELVVTGADSRQISIRAETPRGQFALSRLSRNSDT